MICDDFITEARRNASAWARNLLNIPAHHWIILDTETTGLDENAEVIQIGVTDGAGKVLMDNTPCKPLRPIPAEATAIHHITNEMVQNCRALPICMGHIDAHRGRQDRGRFQRGL